MRKNAKKEKEEVTFEELYLEELRDLYDAERQLIRALPKLVRAASSEELRGALEEHLEQTRGQLERLKQIFELHDEKPTGKHCKGMEGLIEEGQEIIQELKGAEEGILDAALIGEAQKVEHYEIAAYGTACEFASRLSDSDGARLLKETLDEEKEADRKLTDIAESEVNIHALESSAS
jgi:ferritin-like metal-binding protein YciE